MKYILKEENANLIIQYLSKQTFAEVFKLIQILQSMEKFPEKKVVGG